MGCQKVELGVAMLERGLRLIAYRKMRKRENEIY